MTKEARGHPERSRAVSSAGIRQLCGVDFFSPPAWNDVKSRRLYLLMI
jgi:hypothetical protein